MGTPPQAKVTKLLLDWQAGDAGALERLLPLVYDELRRIARAQMRGEQPGHTLQPTALVHEAYGRLVGAEVSLTDRAHFFAIAARVMRQVLVDHARASQRAKRGGDAVHVTLDEGDSQGGEPSVDALDIDRALTKLTEQDARVSQMVEMHYFGGLTYPEIALALELSEATVHRQLRFGRAWLRRELSSK